MNITVTYTNGTGRANRYLVAYDQTCVVTLSGLTLTGTNWLYLTSADGMHALANRAQIAANVATLNLSNTGIESLFGVRQTGRIPALLTVRNGSSGNIAGVASVEITPAADPNVDVVRVGIDYATTADIAALQDQIDALEVGALNIAGLDAKAEAINAATLLAGQESDETVSQQMTVQELADYLAEHPFAHVTFDSDGTTLTTGQIGYDSSTGKFSVKVSDLVTIEIGSEVVLPETPRNIGETTIPDGAAVKLTGGLAVVPHVELAAADDVDVADTIAVATQEITANARGECTTFGAVRGLNTDVSGWSEGDRLYLSTTPGVLTNTAPSTGEVYRVGWLLRKHATQGVIFVSICHCPPVASQAEAEAGTVTQTRLWTPQRVRQAAEAIDPGSIGAYRNQTPAASAEKGGASVAPDFANSLTLPWTLTSNLTSFAAATNLEDGETGMLLITIGAYSLPADPPSGAYKGAWTVTGTLVRVLIERIGSVYLWSADSLEVVS